MELELPEKLALWFAGPVQFSFYYGPQAIQKQKIN